MTDTSNSGWGALCEDRPVFSSWSSLGEDPAYQLPRNDGSFSGPKNLPASPKGAPHPCPFRQHGGDGLHKSPRRSQV